MHPVLRLFLDPIRDNGDINGVAVMFFIAMIFIIAGCLFENMKGY